MQVLLALDTTPGSLRAKEMAWDIAKTRNGQVKAVGIVDPSRVQKPALKALLSDPNQPQEEDSSLTELRARMRGVVERYSNETSQMSFAKDAILKEGNGYDILKGELETCDLAVISRDAEIGGPAGGSGIVQRLANESPRPLIVTSDVAKIGANTLVAYDGSDSAMRALQVFCLMGLTDGGNVVVVSIQADRESAEQHSARAVKFLETYGVQAELRVIETSSDPAAVMGETAQAIDAKFIVMGSRGRSGWLEMLTKSTTNNLMKESKTPLFLYH